MEKPNVGKPVSGCWRALLLRIFLNTQLRVPDLENPTKKTLDLQHLVDLRPTIMTDPHPQTKFTKLSQNCPWKTLRQPLKASKCSALSLEGIALPQTRWRSHYAAPKGLCVTPEGFPENHAVLVVVAVAAVIYYCCCYLPLRCLFLSFLCFLCILDLGFISSPWSKFPSLQLKHLRILDRKSVV